MQESSHLRGNRLISGFQPDKQAIQILGVLFKNLLSLQPRCSKFPIIISIDKNRISGSLHLGIMLSRNWLIRARTFPEGRRDSRPGRQGDQVHVMSRSW